MMQNVAIGILTLSVSPNAIAKSAVDTSCGTDYITIPNGFVGTTASMCLK